VAKTDHPPVSKDEIKAGGIKGHDDHLGGHPDPKFSASAKLRQKERKSEKYEDNGTAYQPIPIVLPRHIHVQFSSIPDLKRPVTTYWFFDSTSLYSILLRNHVLPSNMGYQTNACFRFHSTARPTQHVSPLADT
jgi:hypothetical protein